MWLRNKITFCLGVDNKKKKSLFINIMQILCIFEIYINAKRKNKNYSHYKKFIYMYIVVIVIVYEA